MDHNWADATRTRPPPKKGNGSDPGGVLLELNIDVLRLIRDICYEYLRDTGREIEIPELADKIEHPGR